MANGETLAVDTTKFSVDVSSHSHLKFSSLKKYGEVVFWERPELPELFPSAQDGLLAIEMKDRIDNLANDFYKDSNLMWVLAMVNEVRLPPLQMNPGVVFRVPGPSSVFKSLRGS